MAQDSVISDREGDAAGGNGGHTPVEGLRGESGLHHSRCLAAGRAEWGFRIGCEVVQFGLALIAKWADLPRNDRVPSGSRQQERLATFLLDTADPPSKVLHRPDWYGLT